MKTEVIKIKLVNKNGFEATQNYMLIEIPIVSNEALFNQVFMIRDFGCVFLS
ncbi:hypothetical protein [Tenacibaculum sp. C7A-26P2]|uniref:hypothetical protein n=1 Tax=Tenacibaculum sp. C7A-26P2 TaxID=3447504 RepID=UPI003F8424F5